MLALKVVSVSEATKRVERLTGFGCVVIVVSGVGSLDAATRETITKRVPDFEANVE